MNESFALSIVSQPFIDDLVILGEVNEFVIIHHD